MSLPAVSEILRNPGFLYWNPTGFSSESQYGTKLGYCESGVDFAPNLRAVPLSEEEDGEETSYLVYLGGKPSLSVLLQNYNTVTLARCFPGCGGTSIANYPGTQKIGSDLAADSDIAKPLLFVPNNILYPCLLLQKAVPILSQSWEIKFSHTGKMMYHLFFHGIRKTSAANGGWYLGAISGAALV